MAKLRVLLTIFGILLVLISLVTSIQSNEYQAQKIPQPLHTNISYITRDSTNIFLTKVYITDGLNKKIINFQENTNQLSMKQDIQGKKHLVFGNSKGPLLPAKTSSIKYASEFTDWNVEEVYKVAKHQTLTQIFDGPMLNFDQTNQPIITLLNYKYDLISNPKVHEEEVIVCPKIQSSWACRVVDSENLQSIQITPAINVYKIIDTTIKPNGNLLIAYSYPLKLNNPKIKIIELDKNLNKVGKPIIIDIQDSNVNELSLTYNLIPKITYKTNYAEGEKIQWPTSPNSVTTLFDSNTKSMPGMPVSNLNLNIAGTTEIISFMHYDFNSGNEKIYALDPNYIINPRNAFLKSPELVFDLYKNIIVGGLRVNEIFEGVFGSSYLNNSQIITVFYPTTPGKGNCGEGMFQKTFNCIFYNIPQNEKIVDVAV